MPENHRTNDHRILLGVAFAASGFAALAYQTAWQRVLTQVNGSDSISAVLTIALSAGSGHGHDDSTGCGSSQNQS